MSFLLRSGHELAAMQISGRRRAAVGAVFDHVCGLKNKAAVIPPFFSFALQR